MVALYQPPLSPVMKRERDYAMGLVPDAAATIVAVSTNSRGLASNPATWDQNRLPRRDDIIHIPFGTWVDLDIVMPSFFRSGCIDGVLNVLPDRNTGWGAEFACVCTSDVPDLVSEVGQLLQGTQAAPIQPGFTHTWTIADPGPRDLRRSFDPKDNWGALMSHATWRANGYPKSEFGPLLSASGTTVVLGFNPQGWAVGDQILFPAMDGAQGPAHWEIKTLVAAVGGNGNTITIDSPLQYDHEGLLDVCNVTRNVIFQSEIVDDITRRGYLMQMHRQDVQWSYALCQNLGRTDAMTPHTLPQLDGTGKLIAGTDGNTMGRYGDLHLHVRDLQPPPGGSGWDYAAVTTVGCVTLNSPKHAQVNHGGRFESRRHIAHNCKGSGHFGENGSDFGLVDDFVGSACVGSNDGIDGRIFPYPTPQDNGNRGHAVWATPGIQCTRIRAYGCRSPFFSWTSPQSYDQQTGNANACYESYAYKVSMDAPAELQVANGGPYERPPQLNTQPWPGQVQVLQAGVAVDPTKVQIRTMQAYLHTARFFGCLEGMGTYNVVPGSKFLDIQEYRVGDGWHQQYSLDMDIEDLVINGIDFDKDSYLSPGGGIVSNSQTQNNVFKRGTIAGMQSGVPARGTGLWQFDDFTFRNGVDVEAFQRGGTLILNRPVFLDLGGKCVNVKTAKVLIHPEPVDNGDSTFFDPQLGYFAQCHVIIDFGDGKGPQEIIGDYRRDNFVPFPAGSPLTAWAATKAGWVPAWTDKTNLQLEQQFGVRPGGFEVPESQTFTPHPDVKGGSIGVLGPAVGSSPPPLVTVPNVVGMSYAQAQAALQAAGLTIGPDATTVQSQSPAAQSQASPGSAVTVK